MKIEHVVGVPDFEAEVYREKKSKYAVCIPVINEGKRLEAELQRAVKAHISDYADLIICDGGSVDGSVDQAVLTSFGVQALLVKRGYGKQGAQLRMGLWWALQRGYEGILTIDGNNKDSIESVPNFIAKLENGYDFVQGSRFVPGGEAINTPVIRYWAVRLLHAPIISFTAGFWFTDTTNAFRAYSKRYLEHPGVQPFRNIFMTYELLAYLSVRASQLHLKVCEIPVARVYPVQGKVPTKISFFKGNGNLFLILLKNLFRFYNP